MESDFHKTKRLAESLTEDELELGWKIFSEISSKYPEGFTMLSHLEKIPSPESEFGFVYEYQYSVPIIEFMLKLREAYPDTVMAISVSIRIISEVFQSRSK
ncbi:MAG TPA: hypothetical protein PLV21_02275 [Cyclobacteriaceae bacterium]|nr:hypothetical protein [Cyclobacteriaceae bacterium]HRJ80683.1 hypothetical protein [Cyclobacteriaceae bacterium]